MVYMYFKYIMFCVLINRLCQSTLTPCLMQFYSFWIVYTFPLFACIYLGTYVIYFAQSYMFGDAYASFCVINQTV